MEILLTKALEKDSPLYQINTQAEKQLNNCGFSLEETNHIAITDNLPYTSFKYIRFIDDQKTIPDMIITFDPSQNSIELWNSQNTVFINPDLVAAIHLRCEELKMYII